MLTQHEVDESLTAVFVPHDALLAKQAENNLIHASWIVGSQYKPAELGKR